MTAGKLAAAAVLAACASCIYTASPSLPAHVRTVRVEVFDNATGYPGLDAQLASELARAFLADGTLRPSSGPADAVLTGRLVAVGRGVVQEDALDDVVTGQVVLTAIVTVEEAAGGPKLLDRTAVSSAEARPGAGLYRMRRGETESAARLSAVAELARNIVRRVVEVW